MKYADLPSLAEVAPIGQMTPAFETARLRVFRAADLGDKQHFVAFSPDSDQAIGHIIVSDWRKASVSVFCPLYCELIEMAESVRRQKLGKELFLAMGDRLVGQMQGVAVTPEGIVFLESLGRPAAAIAPHIAEIKPYAEIMFGQDAGQPWADEMKAALATAGNPRLKIEERSQAIKTMKRIMAERIAQLGASS